MKKSSYIIIALSAIFVACATSAEEKKSTTENQKEGSTESQPAIAKNLVDTMHLQRRTFKKQINCNGKLYAIAKSELELPTAGILTEVNVGNGTYVKEGDLMAVVDAEELEYDLKKAERDIQSCYVELLDDLISLGYGQDTTKVPEHILQRVKITSGYFAAMDRYDLASRKMDKCHLYAPFSGRVANITSKRHERANLFCTLIDDEYFNVEFNILEAEISMSKVGEKVVVFPFVDESKLFDGYITEINPVVDLRGQVLVRAKIKNKDGYLIEGMNVRVIMESSSENMFVVPKSAVLLRDGVYVAFRLEDGMALWTYVDVIYSNLDSYAIAGSHRKHTELHDGDVIVTSGNLNLSDGTPISPRAPKNINAPKEARKGGDPKNTTAPKTKQSSSKKR
ncbi:MAG: biotin/lipoyl-binding protein [Rikenellaceae bacterium]